MENSHLQSIFHIPKQTYRTGKKTARGGLISHANRVFSLRVLSDIVLFFHAAIVSSPGIAISGLLMGLCHVVKNSI